MYQRPKIVTWTMSHPRVIGKQIIYLLTHLFTDLFIEGMVSLSKYTELVSKYSEVYE